MLIAGIDIGGTSAKCGVVDPDQGILYQHSIPSGRIAPDELVSALHAWLRALPEPISAVGVGSAGRVDTEADTVRAGNLGWQGVPLRAMLATGLSMPVWVDNDAQAALAAEWRYGVCRNMRDAVYLTLGTGVGGALLMGGRPCRGRSNIACELGHMITHAGGRPCVCGRRGCLEQYASATALKRMADGMPVRDILDGIHAGDTRLRRIFGQYARELAIGMSSLEAIFAPEAIVLGGGLSNAGDLLLKSVGRYYKGRVLIARHANDAGMLGAAALAGLRAGIAGWTGEVHG